MVNAGIYATGGGKIICLVGKLFIIFTTMLPWYVYTLSDKGKVFYVGITRNLTMRYKSHCSSPYENTTNYVYWMREEGRLPDIEVLNVVLNEREAASAEDAVIRQMCISGNKLCNVDINPIYNRIITCNPFPLNERRKPLKKGYAINITKKAIDRFYKLMFHHAYARKDRF